MAIGGDFLSISEAAEALGVSVRHARRLAEAGDLARVARGLIARDSIDRYVAAQRQGARGPGRSTPPGAPSPS